MLKGSCLCGGIRYEIEASARPVTNNIAASAVRRQRGIRHRRDDSSAFISICCRRRTDEGVGIFSRKTAMFLRPLWFTDPQAQ